MLRVLFFFLAVLAIAFGVTRFADRPGSVTLTWLGYEIETSVFVAILALAAALLALALVWSALRHLLASPAALSRYMRRHQEERGLEALSQGLIAVGAGDKDQARKFAALARKKLPNEPLTSLLRAQAAQLQGDRSEARRIFEAMAAQPRTELLGLRGLFLEARREDQMEAARQFAERAMERNPDLGWSVNALFELQCRAGDWEGALKTLGVARRQKHVEKDVAERRRAVLLTAQAIEAEDGDIERARALALEANKLAPGLVPAAEIAARAQVSQGSLSRAGRIVQKAWELSPHPELALAYAHLRPGNSPRDRLDRVKSLAEFAPESEESPIAVAAAAIEAHDWAEARAALAPLVANAPSARVCSLMARIEGGENSDQGRVREWLARAVRAPRDPVWTADGFVSDKWAPVSPVSGALDAFQWKVPVESLAPPETVLAVDSGEVVEIPAAPVPVLPGTEQDAGKGELRPDPGAPRTGDTQSAGDTEVADAVAVGAGQLPDVGRVAVAEAPPGPGSEAGDQRQQPDIFVPPRAPDDPGPEGGERDGDAVEEYPAPKV